MLSKTVTDGNVLTFHLENDINMIIFVFSDIESKHSQNICFALTP